MSTDRQRLKAAIQRIAEKSPAISEAIGASKNRGGQASSTGVGVSDSERDNLCCNGTTGDGANAGAETRDPGEGGCDGLDSADPANIDCMDQGTASGLTDCATGEPICFDGGGWIPPDRWDSPTSPPFHETYNPGFYWKPTTGSTRHYTAAEACTVFGSENTVGGCGDLNDDVDGVDACNCLDENGILDGSVNKLACEVGADDPVCLEEDPPREEFWPEDECTNLAIYGGKIVGSKYDPENDGSYSAPRDELEVCDSSGSRILLRGSPTGGWKSIKSLSGDIDPDTGNGYLYRPSGKKVRQISPSEFRDDTV